MPLGPLLGQLHAAPALALLVLLHQYPGAQEMPNGRLYLAQGGAAAAATHLGGRTSTPADQAAKRGKGHDVRHVA